MTYGQYIGSAILKVTWMMHEFLAGQVSVTTVTGDDGERLEFLLLPEGIELAGFVGTILETYAGLVCGITQIPLLGAHLANLLLILMW